MHQIAMELPEYEHFFSPYYGDGILEIVRKAGLAEFAIVGNKHIQRCREYFKTNGLQEDFQGMRNNYDLVVTCSDLIVPRNIRDKKIVLVQEGMTDPENIFYYLVKALPFLPRWLASTSTTGLSDLYQYFCVASDGYRDLFIGKGANPKKIIVTGIPNFDNCKRSLDNSFPHKNYVLVCTSDTRETFKWENRKAFIQHAVRIAGDRKLIFKLHPNENAERATREITMHAPGALVYPTGNTEEMIANCDILITKWSSVVYIGIALGKEVYSNFDLAELKRLAPLQNAAGARNIARVCNTILNAERSTATEISETIQLAEAAV